LLKLPTEVVSRLRPRYQGVRACVTGGAGFIGGHLVDALFGLGATVTVIDDLSNSTTRALADLVDLDPERVRFVHGSILDDAALADAMDECSLVFHLAAVSSVPRSIAEPERSFLVNTIGTVRVAQAATAAGVSRVVYSASSSAYGDPPGGAATPKVESQVPMPLSPYAASKLGGEHVMRVWSKCYQLSTVSLRYFNIFGPRQPADSPYSGVIAIFAKKLLAGEAPTIYGDGQQSRDFTYVANAVTANLLAGANPRALEGEVVNVGSGRAVTLLELYQAMAGAAGVPHLAPIHVPQRQGDVRHSLASLEVARELLGYAPIVSFEDGLTATMEWYRGLCAESVKKGR
jgi:nucleoside-diphosphate-sugar epimerase